MNTRCLLAAFIMAMPSSAFAASLTVDVNMNKDTVDAFGDDPPDVGSFDGVATIRNTGSQEVHLSVSACDYIEDWKTDNKRINVLPLKGCVQVDRNAVTLKPGEVYDQDVSLAITAQAADDVPAGEMHFHLIYAAKQPKLGPHGSTDEGNFAPLGAPVASNNVGVDIKPVSADREKEWRAEMKWMVDFHNQDDHPPNPNGINKRYSFTGELFDERPFKNGRLDGTAKLYYQNGNVETATDYKDGRMDGHIQSYDEFGNLVSDETFVHGQLVSTITYNLTGSVQDHIRYMKVEGGHATSLPGPCVEGDSSSKSWAIGSMPNCDDGLVRKLK